MIPKLYKYSIYYPFRREIYQRNACMLLDQSLQLVPTPTKLLDELWCVASSRCLFNNILIRDYILRST